MSDPQLRDRVVAALGSAYDVQAEIGRGGMAVVYRAADRRLRRRVAIKVLPPELAFRQEVRTRFLREAQTAAQLSHPNIVPIYSVEEQGGIVCFVMALVEGESLGERMARGPVPLDEGRRILSEVADGLAFAHAHGVIHRDIKPDNILLDRESGRPMLTDFGIARAAEGDGARLTVTGVAVGTPAYMSPEQAIGEREIDGRSDLYSLGVVAYQLLSGDLPFRARNTASMMMKHISELPRPLREQRPDLPPGLAATIDRALAKRPEERWPDAAAMRDALVDERAAPQQWVPRHSDAREDGARSSGAPVPPPEASRPAPGAPAAAPAPPAPGRGSDPLGPGPWSAPRELERPSPLSRRQRREQRREDKRRDLTLDERIALFREHLVRTISVLLMLAGINAFFTPGFPWVIFPFIGMTMGLVGEWSRLSREGMSLRRLFGARAPAGVPAPAPPPRALPPSDAEAARLVPADVLTGHYGDAVRRAVGDRASILAIVQGLAKADRDLLPDVVPTVNALVDRAASLAQMLHRLDADTSPRALQDLERRLASVRAEPESSPDRERRLTLLERQHGSLKDLVQRRERLAGQLESARIALQNLKYDLLKLQSAGVQAALGEVASATVEARALSREIGHVLAAAEEVRGL